jgi:AbrB family looped-hinge helix DNA binding protein
MLERQSSVIIGKVGRRGQIAIPQLIRRRLNIQPGDQVAFTRRGNEIVIQPLTRTLLDLRGSVPVKGRQDFNAIRRQVIEARARDAATADHES